MNIIYGILILILKATQKLCEDVAEAWREVKEAHDKKVKMEQKNQEKLEIPLTEGAKLYEQMKAALFDTQRSVEVLKKTGYTLTCIFDLFVW